MDEQTTHTPGPWKWQDWHFYGDPDEGPSKQTLVGPKDTRPGIHPGHIMIVSFEEPPRNPRDVPLIAAAPNLLAACETALIWMEPVGWDSDEKKQAYEQVRAAVEEARGGGSGD